MRIILRVQAIACVAIVALAVSMSLNACSSLPRVVGAETATKIENASLKAAKTSLTVWKITQDAVLITGRLPRCDDALPDLKICVTAKTWAKIKQIEATTSATILAARPIVEAGTDDVAFLTGVVQAVNDAQIAIAEAKKE